MEPEFHTIAAPRHGPAFDTAVPSGGYLWWYVDALSHDGAHALTVIAFVGSVFSPYYAWSRRADPDDHCALNVMLRGPASDRWTMTERARAATARTPDRLTIGPSRLAWRDGGLDIEIAERGAPLPYPVEGRLRLTPRALPARRFALDEAARHIWQPIAPLAEIAVAMDRPKLTWTGTAYLDSNAGAEPIHRGFRFWTWQRAGCDGRAAVFYDAIRKDGSARGMALEFAPDGGVDERPAPPARAVASSPWGIGRAVRADGDAPVTLRRTLVDSPFYARSLFDARLDGRPVAIMHETLLADRLTNPLVRLMLPFRMPRRR